MNIPQSLGAALQAITVVVGHYGAGKTNFCMNLALDAAESGEQVTVIDLDVVNPYFRASEQRELLESHGVELVAPVFAEAGTSLDVPSLTGKIAPALESAGAGRLVIVDAGGDDVGATALGRFSRIIEQRPHAVLYVANRFRNLVQDVPDAVENMREIEQASHLAITAVVNNSHLKAATTRDDIAQGELYARELCAACDVPLVCTTIPRSLCEEGGEKLYAVDGFVKNPWE